MVKKLFACEICGATFDDEERALECEWQGDPKTFPRVPVGTVLLHTPQSFYAGFVAVVAEDVETWRHSAKQGAFWFRPNAAGDDLRPRFDTGVVLTADGPALGYAVVALAEPTADPTVQRAFIKAQALAKEVTPCRN